MNGEVFKVGDLIRALDDSNANTIYRVLKVKVNPKEPEWRRCSLTIKPIFGLFKQDYKLNKKTSGHGYRKIDLLELGLARNRLDLFIQQEAKRLSGEDVGAPT